MKIKQYGISLLSVLIGLLLSMLCLLALLAVFRTVIKTSIASQKSTVRTANLQNSLMGLQSMIQSAGFGLESGKNLIILENSVFDENNGNIKNNLTEEAEFTSSGQTVLWRYIPAPTISPVTAICQGVTYYNKQLILLTSACSSDPVVGLKTLTWSKSATFSDLTKINVSSITFEKSGTCIPYGFDGSKDASYPKLTITATYPLDPANTSTLMTIKFPICLTNPVTTS
ncbi:hypothetical protein F4V57_06940 [Acinetobacter qingfengensis]|uniref:Uncharacterized protein n=1 Tax=Acinetobacter qingfengensis TaxID=1262585 RepID=A0A1E7R357_9GAMM|nr:hypothetical protein [Acinetobacter qingfengensis]KAA8733782.1 hypothetical protein F4V57_06940 [Acinetobacter qingfengensis]OEY93707.1 hypothetical protein BJI46_04490 [Acinetobacter qingfengensis]